MSMSRIRNAIWIISPIRRVSWTSNMRSPTALRLVARTRRSFCGMPEIRVIGGGPAGSAAALSALQQGASGTVFEKTRFPRHKDCGEFLQPEAATIFGSLGLLPEFLELQPHAVRRANVYLGRAEK